RPVAAMALATTRATAASRNAIVRRGRTVGGVVGINGLPPAWATGRPRGFVVGRSVRASARVLRDNYATSTFVRQAAHRDADQPGQLLVRLGGDQVDGAVLEERVLGAREDAAHLVRQDAGAHGPAAARLADLRRSLELHLQKGRRPLL